MANVKAENTAQPHVLLVRGELERLLPNPMDTITPVIPKTEAQWKEAERWPAQGHGWRYIRGRGNHVYFMFEDPILWGQVDQAMYRGMKAGGLTADDSPFVAKMEGKRVTKKVTGDNVGEESKGHKASDIILGTSRMLVETTKMGCYSWNLPAGPMRFGGACPGANMAFQVPHVADIDPMAGVRIRNAVRRSKTYSVGKYAAAVPKDNAAIAHRFICNGCYAMKGSYGNPSVMVAMTWKKMWLRGFALPTGQFVDAMVEAIQVSRRKLRKTRSNMDPRKLASIPHPDFFRIHDSGDFFSREYFEAWLDVCRAMPDVHFWAPSRVWTTAALARDVERIIAQGKLPKNLALRPSGLFFDGPEPNVPGYAGGTSSAQIVFDIRGSKMTLDIASTSPKTWGCPAYLPEVIGGGAEPVVKTDRKILEERIATLFPKATISGNKGKYVLTIPGQDEPIKGKTIEEIGAKYDEMLSRLPKQNPVGEQVYGMYPQIDDATLEDPKFVFYDALFDPKRQAFIVDRHSGRPMKATKANLKAHPGAIVTKAQAYQAAGSCSVARDPRRAAECRVCWGTTGPKRSEKMKRLPVVYGKH